MQLVARLLTRLRPLVQTFLPAGSRLLLDSSASLAAARIMSTGSAPAAAARAHTPPSSPSRDSPAIKKVKLDSLATETEEEALASSSTAGPLAAVSGEPTATGKGKKAPPPKNAPAPGPRKVVKPSAGGPRRVKRKPVDEVVLNEIKVRPRVEQAQERHQDCLLAGG